MSNDVDTDLTAPQADAEEPLVQETVSSLFVRALKDGIIGGIAGLAGSVAILGTLLLATVAGGFSLDAFRQFPQLFGLDAVLTADQVLLLGIGVFVLGGMVVWPLVLATLGMYLPGENYATQGLFFGGVTWTGFVLYFYPGVSGLGLAVYVVASFVGHLGYGFVMGATMDRLFADRPPLVSFALRNPERTPGAVAGATNADGSEASASDEE